MAEASEGDGDIAFRAADADIEATALEQKFAVWRCQAKQQFAEADDFHAASA
jgi:hypothetical protein